MWSTCEADAVEVEDHVDAVDRPRLVPDLHPPEHDLVQEAGQPVLDLRVILDQLGQILVAVHQVVVVERPDVEVPVLEAYKLPLLWHGMRGVEQQPSTC